MAQRLLISTRKGLFEWRQDPGAKGNWQNTAAHFLGEPVTLTHVDSTGERWYAALNHGHFGTKLHASNDQGQSWQEVAVPSYEGVADTELSLDLIWSLKDNGAGRLWAGTIPGGLFSSDDQGESWQLNQALWQDPSREQWFGGGYDQPGIHSICIDPRNSNVLTIGISCGGVWRSDDNGASWRAVTEGLAANYVPPEQKHNPAIQDPHCLVQCRDEPDHFWIQHHNGIFRSSDNANTWQEITGQPSSFGFACAVDPSAAQRAWFVPAISDELRYPVDAKLLVSKTEDGGESFMVKDNGLPQQASYDLIYRHALAIDEQGECLAMGSTTGNLWLSPDAGESWQNLANHLPPIYALGFAP